MFGWSMRRWLLILAVFAWGWMAFFRTPPDAAAVLRKGDYTITELEPYTQTVRVLGREEYLFGREADLSPLDIAVGWGEMARPEVYKHFKVSQGGRWYYWRSEDMPIEQRAVETQSANVHIVPATPAIARQLRRIRREDLVQLSGALIEVVARDGWRWKSSLTREDVGEGACELLLLKRVEWTSLKAAAKP
jgi:hypothetical protein